jgi:hypothetical protein
MVNEIMRIEDAIQRIYSMPGWWVKVDQIRRIPRGLELGLGVYKGRRGKKAEAWRIACLGVREFWVDDLDGGGIAVYSASHPAARRFVAPLAVLGWATGGDAVTIAALYEAHLEVVQDWIAFERYVDIQAIAEGRLICRGPDFLMRAYAKALRRVGAQPRLGSRQKRKPAGARPRALHLGSSCVVATTFLAERQP